VKAQSEAPSVDGLTDILDSFHNRMLQAQPFDNDPTKEESSLIEGIWDETEAKINRLIAGAEENGILKGLYQARYATEPGSEEEQRIDNQIAELSNNLSKGDV
jgi:hypothetical protein